MGFDLVDCGRDLGCFKKLFNLVLREVADSDASDLSFGYQTLHGCPRVFRRDFDKRKQIVVVFREELVSLLSKRHRPMDLRR